MKITISHDVVYLYFLEHLKIYLILEKCGFGAFCISVPERISFTLWVLSFPFRREMYHIDKIIPFNRARGMALGIFLSVDNVFDMGCFCEKAALPFTRRKECLPCNFVSRLPAWQLVCSGNEAMVQRSNSVFKL